MRTGVSDISERIGVIIKRSERGGEIVDDLLCRTQPHKCRFLLMTVLLQDLTPSNSYQLQKTL